MSEFTDDTESDVQPGARDWADAAKFAKLRKALESSLTDLRVYRVGKVTVDVYLVGTTKGGELAGVHTKSIET